MGDKIGCLMIKDMHYENVHYTLLTQGLLLSVKVQSVVFSLGVLSNL